jgi:hypothetical protein
MNKTTTHQGIWVSDLKERAAAGDEAAARDLREYQSGPGHPVDADPARKVCRTCGRGVHFRRRTYGPNGRAGGWSHNGDGLAQFRSWR